MQNSVDSQRIHPLKLRFSFARAYIQQLSSMRRGANLYVKPVSNQKIAAFLANCASQN